MNTEIENQRKMARMSKVEELKAEDTIKRLEEESKKNLETMKTYQMIVLSLVFMIAASYEFFIFHYAFEDFKKLVGYIFIHTSYIVFFLSLCSTIYHCIALTKFRNVLKFNNFNNFFPSNKGKKNYKKRNVQKRNVQKQNVQKQNVQKQNVQVICEHNKTMSNKTMSNNKDVLDNAFKKFIVLLEINELKIDSNDINFINFMHNKIYENFFPVQKYNFNDKEEIKYFIKSYEKTFEKVAVNKEQAKKFVSSLANLIATD